MAEEQSKILSGQKRIVPIKGNSMFPLLNEKTDYAVLEAIDGPVGLYDVVMFVRPGGQKILHRVLKVERGKCFISGDNTNRGEWVRNKRIKYRMTAYIRNGRYVSLDTDAYHRYVESLEKDPSNRQGLSFHETKIAKEAFKDLVRLVRYALNHDLPGHEIQNWQLVYTYACDQMVSALCAGASRDLNCPAPLSEQFSRAFGKSLEKTILYRKETQILTDKLKEASVDYLLLKPFTIQKLYPREGTREFADHDILVRGDEGRVDEIFSSMGYTKTSCGHVHDVYQKKPFFNFEIHKKLFDEINEHAAYFEGIWERAKPVEEHSHEYRLSKTDMYLYLLAHLKKHAEGNGTGLRSFVDLYLLNRSLEPEEKESFYACLEKAGLASFYEHMTNVSEKLFERDPSLDDEALALISRRGAYGSFDEGASKQIRKMGKGAYLHSRLFPGKKTMVKIYPRLGAHILTLPIAWLMRGLRAVTRPGGFRRMRHEFRLVRRAEDGEKG